MQSRLPADERRDQLLEIALAAFGTNGYHGTSMNTIAEAAGITKPVVYQHFDSKHELFLTLLVDIGDRLRAAIVAALTSSEGSPRGLVEAGFAAFFEFFGAEPNAFAVLFGDGVREDADFLHELEKVEESLVENILAVLHMPELSDDNRRVLAQGIVGMCERIGRYWLDRGFDLDPTELARQTAEMAYFGLRGPKPA